MNTNFGNFLNSSLRILNIANKSLPLIKNVTPTIKGLKKGVSSLRIKHKKEQIREPIIIPKSIHQNNSLTFFK